MILTPSNGPDVKPLTPERAKEYLQKKPQYLATWKKLVPYYFEAGEFCALIDEIRVKRIARMMEIDKEIQGLKQKREEKGLSVEKTNAISSRITMLEKGKNNVFSNKKREVFNEKIAGRIQNSNTISYREVNQLIGSLANISKTPKEQIQEVTGGVNQELHEDLSHLEVYEYEFSTISADLEKQYLESNIGATVSNDEKKGFSDQSWSIFLRKHTEDIKNGKIDTGKLNVYLRSKNLIY